MEGVKTVPLTKDHYDVIFREECHSKYPVIDTFEKNWGYKLATDRLEGAARVLACPMKVNPPNWQHGRIIYTVLRKYLRRFPDETVTLVDIGTAKGFSALVMKWAVMDARAKANIVSVDVIDPEARVRRNTVAEVGGLKTLRETLAEWPESETISFQQLGGSTYLAGHRGRINFAFVDGKHRYDAVRVEGGILRMKQESGDVTIYDDVQIPGVAQAVDELKGYAKDFIAVNALRRYCIATRE